MKHKIRVYYPDETRFDIDEECDAKALQDGKGISEQELVEHVSVILVRPHANAEAVHFMNGNLVGG